jgi:hypothetical protein
MNFGAYSRPPNTAQGEVGDMLATVMQHLLYRRRVRAARAWRDTERAEYLRAVQRITALKPAGMGTLRRPRS